MVLTVSERKDLHFFATDPQEGPGSSLWANLQVKAGDTVGSGDVVAVIE